MLVDTALPVSGTVGALDELITVELGEGGHIEVTTTEEVVRTVLVPKGGAPFAAEVELRLAASNMLKKDTLVRLLTRDTLDSTVPTVLLELVLIGEEVGYCWPQASDEAVPESELARVAVVGPAFVLGSTDDPPDEGSTISGAGRIRIELEARAEDEDKPTPDDVVGAGSRSAGSTSSVVSRGSRRASDSVIREAADSFSQTSR